MVLFIEPAVLLDRYFEVARWWGDLAYVLRLPVPAMLRLRDQAERLNEMERRRP